MFRRLKLHGIQRHVLEFQSRLHSDFFRHLLSSLSLRSPRSFFQRCGFGIREAPLAGQTMCTRTFRCKSRGAAGACRRVVAPVHFVGRRYPPQAHTLGTRYDFISMTLMAMILVRILMLGSPRLSPRWKMEVPPPPLPQSNVEGVDEVLTFDFNIASG